MSWELCGCGSNGGLQRDYMTAETIRGAAVSAAGAKAGLREWNSHRVNKLESAQRVRPRRKEYHR